MSSDLALNAAAHVAFIAAHEYTPIDFVYCMHEHMLASAYYWAVNASVRDVNTYTPIQPFLTHSPGRNGAP